jgi:hypothetical protein
MSLARDLRLALSPTELLREAGVEPDPWQRRFLDCPAPQVCLLASRQVGKSLSVSARVLFEALNTPGALCLMVAPSQRQSAELFKKCLTLYRALGHPVDEALSSQSRVELSNGSRIISLPSSEQTLRGYSAPAVLVLEEAQGIPDEVYQSLRPAMAVSSGTLIACGTAGPRVGWFHDVSEDDDEDWRRFRVPYSECPRIRQGYIETERRALPDHVFRAEYLTEWYDPAQAIFSPHLIEQAFAADADMKPLFADQFDPFAHVRSRYDAV